MIQIKTASVYLIDWHARLMQPSVPVNLLHSLQTGELLQEESFELIRVDRLVGKVVVVGFEERLKDICASDKILQVPEEGGALFIGHHLVGER